MQIRRRSFPHPVLSPFGDDLVNRRFQAEVRVRSDRARNSYTLVVECRTDSRDLVELIRNRKACYACHLECTTTRFRQLVQSFDEKFEVDVPADAVEGKVEYCCFILAAEDLPTYRNSDFHSDYEGLSFRVGRGDILAVDCGGWFAADRDIDPLRKIPSIFTVAVNPDPDAEPMDIDATGHKVVIRLSRENFHLYRMLSQDAGLQAVLSTLLVLPALVHLLDEIKGGRVDAYEECRWYRVVAKKLREMGVNAEAPDSWPDSTLCLAQKLIGDPLTRSLKVLEELVTDE